MIEVTLTGLFEAVLIGIAVAAGISVLWDRLAIRNGVRALRGRAMRCRICSATYRREPGNVIQACPECGSDNPCGRDRRLG